MIEVNLNGAFYMSRAALAAHDRPRLRPDREHQLGDRRDREHRPGELRRGEGGAVRAHDDAWRSKARARASPSTASRPGFIATEMVAAVPEEILARIVEQIPVGAARDARGGRARRRVPRRRRLGVHHRAGVLDQRRAVHVSRTAATRGAGDAVGPEASACRTRSTRSRSAKQARSSSPGSHGTRPACCRRSAATRRGSPRRPPPALRERSARMRRGRSSRPGRTSASPTRRGRRTRRYFWLQQSYLLFGRLAQELVEAGAGSRPEARKLRLATEIVVDALAPTNVAARQPGRAQARVRDRRRLAPSAARATSSPTS